MKLSQCERKMGRHCRDSSIEDWSMQALSESARETQEGDRGEIGVRSREWAGVSAHLAK